MTQDYRYGPTNPHPLSQMKTELVWEGKYDEFGRRREVDVAACAMPFQKIETVDEPRQRAEAEGQLDLFEQRKAESKKGAGDGGAGVSPAKIEGSVGVSPEQGSVGVSPAKDEENKINRGQDARAPVGDRAPVDARAPMRVHAPFLNPFEEVQKHRHHLPHWQQDECWQFVTWRLADSIPRAKLEQWRQEKEAWRKRHPQPWDDAMEKEYHERFSERIDEWLDAGHGECVLRRPECAMIVADAMRKFSGSRYELGAFVVMPNHAHALFRPLAGHALHEIIHSWKSFTAKAINKALNRTGTLWQEDYWDRMIRHEAHLLACLRYIEDNPSKAHLREGEFIFERSATQGSAGVGGAGDRGAGVGGAGDRGAGVGGAGVGGAGVSPANIEGSVGVSPAIDEGNPLNRGQDARAPVDARPPGEASFSVDVKLTKFLPSLAEVPSKELEAPKERSTREPI